MAATKSSQSPVSSRENGQEIPECQVMAAEKGPQLSLLMEHLRQKSCQQRSWADSIKALRGAITDKRHAPDTVERSCLQRCLESLLTAISAAGQQSVSDRLELMARQLGLKFSQQSNNGLVISCDMFHVEVTLDATGAAKIVRLAHQGEPVVNQEMQQLLSSGEIDQFTEHLQGLSNIYQITGDKKQKAKAFLALQSLETDLNLLAQLQSSINGVGNYIHKSPLGILIPRKGGLPMKLIYFVSPYDLLNKKTNMAHPMTVEAIMEHELGQSVTVCIESAPPTRLQSMPLMTVNKSHDGKSLPSFPGLSNLNSCQLPACFVLRLPKPIPLSVSIIKKIQNLTSAEILSGNLQCRALLSLIVDDASDGSVKSDKRHSVTLPDQQHSYYLQCCNGAVNQEGALVSRIPFTHPTNVPQILVYLRQQLVFNSVVASCIRPDSKKEDEECLVFEVSALSLQQITISFEHPLQDSIATADLDLSDITNLKCRVCTVTGADSLVTDDYITKVFQRCLSISVTMRAILRNATTELKKQATEESELQAKRLLASDQEHVTTLSTNFPVPVFNPRFPPKALKLARVPVKADIASRSNSIGVDSSLSFQGFPGPPVNSSACDVTMSTTQTALQPGVMPQLATPALPQLPASVMTQHLPAPVMPQLPPPKQQQQQQQHHHQQQPQQPATMPQQHPAGLPQQQHQATLPQQQQAVLQQQQQPTLPQQMVAHLSRGASIESGLGQESINMNSSLLYSHVYQDSAINEGNPNEISNNLKTTPDKINKTPMLASLLDQEPGPPETDSPMLTKLLEESSPAAASTVGAVPVNPSLLAQQQQQQRLQEHQQHLQQQGKRGVKPRKRKSTTDSLPARSPKHRINDDDLNWSGRGTTGALGLENSISSSHHQGNITSMDLEPSLHIQPMSEMTKPPMPPPSMVAATSAAIHFGGSIGGMNFPPPPSNGPTTMTSAAMIDLTDTEIPTSFMCESHVSKLATTMDNIIKEKSAIMAPGVPGGELSPNSYNVTSTIDMRDIERTTEYNAVLLLRRQKSMSLTDLLKDSPPESLDDPLDICDFAHFPSSGNMGASGHLLDRHSSVSVFSESDIFKSDPTEFRASGVKSEPSAMYESGLGSVPVQQEALNVHQGVRYDSDAAYLHAQTVMSPPVSVVLGSKFSPEFPEIKPVHGTMQGAASFLEETRKTRYSSEYSDDNSSLTLEQPRVLLKQDEPRIARLKISTSAINQYESKTIISPQGEPMDFLSTANRYSRLENEKLKGMNFLVSGNSADGAMTVGTVNRLAVDFEIPENKWNHLDENHSSVTSVKSAKSTKSKKEKWKRSSSESGKRKKEKDDYKKEKKKRKMLSEQYSLSPDSEPMFKSVAVDSPNVPGGKPMPKLKIMKSGGRVSVHTTIPQNKSFTTIVTNDKSSHKEKEALKKKQQSLEERAAIFNFEISENLDMKERSRSMRLSDSGLKTYGQSPKYSKSKKSTSMSCLQSLIKSPTIKLKPIDIPLTNSTAMHSKVSPKKSHVSPQKTASPATSQASVNKASQSPTQPVSVRKNSAITTIICTPTTKYSPVTKAYSSVIISKTQPSVSINKTTTTATSTVYKSHIVSPPSVRKMSTIPKNRTPSTLSKTSTVISKTSPVTTSPALITRGSSTVVSASSQYSATTVRSATQQNNYTKLMAKLPSAIVSLSSKMSSPSAKYSPTTVTIASSKPTVSTVPSTKCVAMTTMVASRSPALDVKKNTQQTASAKNSALSVKSTTVIVSTAPSVTLVASSTHNTSVTTASSAASARTAKVTSPVSLASKTSSVSTTIVSNTAVITVTSVITTTAMTTATVTTTTTTTASTTTTQAKPKAHLQPLSTATSKTLSGNPSVSVTSSCTPISDANPVTKQSPSSVSSAVASVNTNKPLNKCRKGSLSAVIDKLKKTHAVSDSTDSDEVDKVKSKTSIVVERCDNEMNNSVSRSVPVSTDTGQTSQPEKLQLEPMNLSAKESSSSSRSTSSSSAVNSSSSSKKDKETSNKDSNSRDSPMNLSTKCSKGTSSSSGASASSSSRRESTKDSPSLSKSDRSDSSNSSRHREHRSDGANKADKSDTSSSSNSSRSESDRSKKSSESSDKHKRDRDSHRSSSNSSSSRHRDDKRKDGSASSVSKSSSSHSSSNKDSSERSSKSKSSSSSSSGDRSSKTATPTKHLSSSSSTVEDKTTKHPSSSSSSTGQEKSSGTNSPAVKSSSSSSSSKSSSRSSSNHNSSRHKEQSVSKGKSSKESSATSTSSKHDRRSTCRNASLSSPSLSSSSESLSKKVSTTESSRSSSGHAEKSAKIPVLERLQLEISHESAASPSSVVSKEGKENSDKNVDAKDKDRTSTRINCSNTTTNNNNNNSGSTGNSHKYKSTQESSKLAQTSSKSLSKTDGKSTNNSEMKSSLVKTYSDIKNSKSNTSVESGNSESVVKNSDLTTKKGASLSEQASSKKPAASVSRTAAISSQKSVNVRLEDVSLRTACTPLNVLLSDEVRVNGPVSVNVVSQLPSKNSGETVDISHKHNSDSHKIGRENQSVCPDVTESVLDKREHVNSNHGSRGENCTSQTKPVKVKRNVSSVSEASSPEDDSLVIDLPSTPKSAKSISSLASIPSPKSKSDSTAGSRSSTPNHRLKTPNQKVSAQVQKSPSVLVTPVIVSVNNTVSSASMTKLSPVTVTAHSPHVKVISTPCSISNGSPECDIDDDLMDEVLLGFGVS